jgi:site-specific DNA-methyltransferase (adenine-specific)
LKPKANLIIWSNPLGKEIISSVCKDLRYQLIGEYLWLKKSSDKGTQETLLRCYESALIFAKDVAQENKEIIEVCGRSKKRYDLPWSVVSSYHDNSQPHPHPCHKPAIVLKPLLSTWTRHGDVILDPFAGSGGVPLALKELDGGRKYVGIEILDQWVLAANRSLQPS